MHNNISFIAIDDNTIDLMLLSEYAKQYSFLQNCGTFNSGLQGIEAIKTIQPQLVFLDIEMPEQSGIEVLKEIQTLVPMSIFISSHAEFAIDGFQLSAFDFILKPLTTEKFLITANRIKDYWDMKQKAIAYEVLFEQEMLTIKEGHTQILLPQSDIIYLEAMQDYTKIVTAKKNYLTLTTLTSFIEKLSASKFIRVHRSYAIAISKVTTIETNKIICGNVVIPIGKTYKDIVNNFKYK